MDVCSNKRFVKDQRFIFLPSWELVWHINDIFDFYLNCDNGLKINTFEKCFKTAPWIMPQAAPSSVDLAGITIGCNAKGKHFGGFFNIRANYFDLHPYPYVDNVIPYQYLTPLYAEGWRFKWSLGGSYENDIVTVLLKGAYYDDLIVPNVWALFSKIKVKSDVFVRIADRVLLHFSLRQMYNINYDWQKDNFHINTWNIGLGMDYILSDMLSAFITAENILHNPPKQYSGLSGSFFKLLFGVTLTPNGFRGATEKVE